MQVVASFLGITQERREASGSAPAGPQEVGDVSAPFGQAHQVQGYLAPNELPFALHAPLHWAILGVCDQEEGRCSRVFASFLGITQERREASGSAPAGPQEVGDVTAPFGQAHQVQSLQ